jgi:hypothetical protein
MIKTLLVSGCSFTSSHARIAWPDHTAKHLGIDRVVNLAYGGAGNDYICNSIIDYIEDQNPDPATTLVMAMWSGPSRRDILVSGEYWYLLGDYIGKAKYQDRADCYWVFSGGRSNSWIDHPETRKLFEPLYVSDDPFVLCKQTLANIVKLQSYLESKRYRFKFTSFVNYWNPDVASGIIGEFSIGHFAKDLPIYKNLNFEHWFFNDAQRNCFGEYALERGLIEADGFHPTEEAHGLYAENIVVPNLKDFK